MQDGSAYFFFFFFFFGENAKCLNDALVNQSLRKLRKAILTQFHFAANLTRENSTIVKFRRRENGVARREAAVKETNNCRGDHRRSPRS